MMNVSLGLDYQFVPSPGLSLFMIASPIFVAGHRGMVGSAICRQLSMIPGVSLVTQTRQELDLCDTRAVENYFESVQPKTVIFASAKVGGIHANESFPVEFLNDNLLQELATINASFRHGVERFLFLGSTCIYPRLANQPIHESALLSGPLEPTNEAYALAKIAGLKLCQYYRQQYGVVYHSAMPTNLYGPGDNYHPSHSHVLPGLIHRFHNAKKTGMDEVTIWGSGKPLREFLHVDDLAAAVIHLCQLESPPDWVNVGTGLDISILDLAKLIAEVVGYRGRIATDPTKPDGTPRKLTDISAIRATGWEPKIPLKEGIRRTYEDFCRDLESGILRQV